MLNKLVRLYVPGTNGGKLDAEIQRKTKNYVAFSFTKMFGGATMQDAEGFWMDAHSQVVQEPVAIVWAFTDVNTLSAYKDKVFELAQWVAYRMQQEAIALEIDGVMHFVTEVKLAAA